MKLNKRFLKYLFFGGANTLITFIIYAVLVKIGFNYLLASSACYAIGIIEGFLFNAYFVFKHKPQLNSLTKYSLVYAVAYLINIFILYLLVSIVSVPKLEAQLIAVVFVTVINFKLIKLAVFK